MADWARAAREALEEGPAALVSVLATEGSAPREAGTRMVVTPRGLAGTIGGGRLELQATEQARALLGHPPGTWRVQDYPLGPLLGQCCGGRVRLLVERLDPAESTWLERLEPGRTLVTRFAADRLERAVTAGGRAPPSARGERPAPGDAIAEPIDPPPLPVLLFGAGHVGRAIVRAAANLPFVLTWLDTRPETAAETGATRIEEGDACVRAAAAGAGDAVLILTHDHGLDYRLVAAALAGEAGFVGLIGSATKRARFLAKLVRDGFDAAAQARLVCPIGLPSIHGKEPAVIAISVLAQLLERRG